MTVPMGYDIEATTNAWHIVEYADVCHELPVDYSATYHE